MRDGAAAPAAAAHLARAGRRPVRHMCTGLGLCTATATSRTSVLDADGTCRLIDLGLACARDATTPPRRGACRRRKAPCRRSGVCRPGRAYDGRAADTWGRRVQNAMLTANAPFHRSTRSRDATYRALRERCEQGVGFRERHGARRPGRRASRRPRGARALRGAAGGQPRRAAQRDDVCRAALRGQHALPRNRDRATRVRARGGTQSRRDAMRTAADVPCARRRPQRAYWQSAMASLGDGQGDASKKRGSAGSAASRRASLRAFRDGAACTSAPRPSLPRTDRDAPVACARATIAPAARAIGGGPRPTASTPAGSRRGRRRRRALGSSSARGHARAQLTSRARSARWPGTSEALGGSKRPAAARAARARMPMVAPDVDVLAHGHVPALEQRKEQSAGVQQMSPPRSARPPSLLARVEVVDVQPGVHGRVVARRRGRAGHDAVGASVVPAEGVHACGSSRRHARSGGRRAPPPPPRGAAPGPRGGLAVAPAASPTHPAHSSEPPGADRPAARADDRVEARVAARQQRARPTPATRPRSATEGGHSARRVELARGPGAAGAGRGRRHCGRACLPRPQRLERGLRVASSATQARPCSSATHTWHASSEGSDGGGGAGAPVAPVHRAAEVSRRTAAANSLDLCREAPGTPGCPRVARARRRLWFPLRRLGSAPAATAARGPWWRPRR